MGVALLQLIIWFVTIYFLELNSKFNFVHLYRQVKNYHKLKSISNILIHRNVRECEFKGRKNIDDTHTNVTVLQCEIDNFDEIISVYSLEKGLIDLLESFQSGFDLLCDQYGVEKVEQVAKKFTVCAGIKMCDNRIDQRLLGIHHSVRIVDFALALKSFVSSKSLKNGRKMQLKIGIHSGPVVSGVLGQLKPQFSLFGDTIDTADQICNQSSNAKVLISEETQKILDQFSNNFSFLNREFKIEGKIKLKVF